MTADKNMGDTIRNSDVFSLRFEILEFCWDIQQFSWALIQHVSPGDAFKVPKIALAYMSTADVTGS